MAGVLLTVFAFLLRDTLSPLCRSPFHHCGTVADCCVLSSLSSCALCFAISLTYSLPVLYSDPRCLLYLSLCMLIHLVLFRIHLHARFACCFTVAFRASRAFLFVRLALISLGSRLTLLSWYMSFLVPLFSTFSTGFHWQSRSGEPGSMGRAQLRRQTYVDV